MATTGGSVIEAFDIARGRLAGRLSTETALLRYLVERCGSLRGQSG